MGERIPIVIYARCGVCGEIIQKKVRHLAFDPGAIMFDYEVVANHMKKHGLAPPFDISSMILDHTVDGQTYLVYVHIGRGVKHARRKRV